MAELFHLQVVAEQVQGVQEPLDPQGIISAVYRLPRWAWMV